MRLMASGTSTVCGAWWRGGAGVWWWCCPSAVFALAPCPLLVSVDEPECDVCCCLSAPLEPSSEGLELAISILEPEDPDDELEVGYPPLCACVCADEGGSSDGGGDPLVDECGCRLLCSAALTRVWKLMLVRKMSGGPNSKHRITLRNHHRPKTRGSAHRGCTHMHEHHVTMTKCMRTCGGRHTCEPRGSS